MRLVGYWKQTKYVSSVTALTGQASLGQLVQGYLSSGGDLKAALIGQFIGKRYVNGTLPV